MARPDKLPRWADGGAADVVEPSEGKKETGWDAVNTEKPPGQYFNWWQNKVQQWFDYLRLTFIASWFMTVENLAGDTWSTTGGAGAYDSVNGRFALFGTASATQGIATSDDGINWTKRTAAGGGNAFGIDHDGSALWVLVSGVALIQSSSDAITWTTRTPGSSYGGDFRDVAHDQSGVWVAVGELDGGSTNQGEIQTSTNGTAWTSRTSGVSLDLNGIAYSPTLSLWVTVGDTGTILTAPDPTGTWTSRTSGTTNNLQDVAWGDGAFVAFGDSGTILRSTNGTTWVDVTVGTTAAGDGKIRFGDGVFLIIRSGLEMLASTDAGETWTTLSVDFVQAVAFGPSYWVGFGGTTGTPDFFATLREF